MRINNVIKHVRLNSLKYINYFEAIIYEDGDIELVKPSHIETLIRYCMKKENFKTRQDVMDLIPITYDTISFIVDKYHCISVWYDCMLYSIDGINDKQKEVIERLKKKKIVSPFIDIKSRPTREYHHYLEFYKNNNENN